MGRIIKSIGSPQLIALQGIHIQTKTVTFKKTEAEHVAPADGKDMPAQSRFVSVKAQNGEWHIMDMKCDTPHIVCTCSGWKAPMYAEYIVSALESYHQTLVNKFSISE